MEAQKVREKCGIFGVYGKGQDSARLVYYGLWALQHRGQENSGIISSSGRKLYAHKGHGLVSRVYKEKDLTKLKGHISIGHNRYSTFGKSAIDHSQPVFDHTNTVALAHNGNLPVVKSLHKKLKQLGVPTNGLNDSEMMHRLIEYWTVKGFDIVDAVKKSVPYFTGAYSLLVMTKKELVAVRDPKGIRPLCIGKLNGTFVFASETCALDAIGAVYIRDVEPGELVSVSKKGLESFKFAGGDLKLDVFELIYFARPDSVLLDQSVYEVRKRLGVQLAKERALKVDAIIPVPDSSIPSAIGYAQETGLPLEQALVKNRYIHRTFIKPAQRQRATGVSMKLNIVKHLVSGKRVALVDDSIVRGTTSKHLVKLVKDAGAKEVHFLVPSPPVLYPDFYGIDTPKQKELIAANMTLSKLRSYIGAETLTYLSFDGMLKALKVPRQNLCTACFTGEYPISIGQKSSGIKRVQVGAKITR